MRSYFDQVELYKIAGDDSFIPGGMYQASPALGACRGPALLREARVLRPAEQLRARLCAWLCALFCGSAF
jgi:hypothetical protein